MAIVDVRIDDRLIHGQVCGFWIPHYSVERILIVDNEIVNDEQRKAVLKFGCPTKCKLSIFDAAKAAEKLKRHIDEGIRVMILCNSPAPILDMVKQGYAIESVTIGNMSTKENAQQIKKTVFVSPKEKDDFHELVNHGVKLYSQMVPNETRENVTESFR